MRRLDMGAWAVALWIAVGSGGVPAEAQDGPREFAIEGGLVLTLWDRWDYIWPEEDLSNLEHVVFGATARSPQGGVLAELRVERYVSPEVTQARIQAINQSQLALVDSAMRLVVQQGDDAYEVVQWVGTRTESHNGVYQLVAPHIRESRFDGSRSAHHLIRIFNGENSFDVMISHPLEWSPTAQMMQERLVRDVMRNLELRALESGSPPW